MCKLFFFSLLLCNYIIVIIKSYLKLKNGNYWHASFHFLAAIFQVVSVVLGAQNKLVQWLWFAQCFCWCEHFYSELISSMLRLNMFPTSYVLLLLLACKPVIVSVNFEALSLCNLFNVCKYMFMKRLQYIMIIIIIIIIIIMENFI